MGTYAYVKPITLVTLNTRARITMGIKLNIESKKISIKAHYS